MNTLWDSFSQDELIKLTMDMIEIGSYPGIYQQETKMAKYIQSVLEDEGIDCRIKEVKDGRSNLIATIKGKGNGKKKNLLFTGHTDTVPPYDMEDALYPKIIDGKLYGRGAVDMKGPLACMIGTMIAIKRLGITISGDLLFAAVIDEEHGSLGTIDLVEEGINAHGAIVGEPTQLQICTSHRGLEWFEFVIKGKPVHSGMMKEGINAISKAGDLIHYMNKELVPIVSKRVHPVTGPSTINYGSIKGGTQPSTVAGECILSIDRRWIPGEKYEDVVKEFEDILDDMNKKDPDFSCKLRVMKESIMEKGYIHESMEIDPNHLLVRISQESLKFVIGEDLPLTYFPAWTDGGIINTYGKIPTIVWGPGSLESAHSPEEHISIDELVNGYRSYLTMAMNWFDSPENL